MNVTKSHHIDASELNERGKYDYYYAFTSYVFAQDGMLIFARSYDDEPKVASFAGMQLDEEIIIFTPQYQRRYRDLQW